LAKYNVDDLFFDLRIWEFMPHNWIPRAEALPIVRAFPKEAMKFLGVISDSDPSLDNYKRIDVLIGHDPGGTSIYNLRHWK